MDDSIAQVRFPSVEIPAWKSILSLSSAILLALLFLSAGLWKISDPYGMAQRMVQAKVPAELGLFTAVSFGIAETAAAILLLMPSTRRWGAWLTGGMLIAFMIYVGYHYDALRGEECSCFPLIKRAVGPGFFIGDGIMLLMAVIAGLWAKPSTNLRRAVLVILATAVTGLVSFGYAYSQQTGAKAPDSITVNGAPYSLQVGKHFLYFFDPECSHCYQAAKTMSGFKWTGAKIIGIATERPQFAAGFLKDTGLKAEMSPDLALLKKTFPFVDGPFGVALENGRQKQSFIHFDAKEPETSLRKLGFIE